MAKQNVSLTVAIILIILAPVAAVATPLWYAYLAHDIWSEMVSLFGWRPVSVIEFAIGSQLLSIARGPNLMLTTRESKWSDIGIIALSPLIIWLVAKGVLLFV